MPDVILTVAIIVCSLAILVVFVLSTLGSIEQAKHLKKTKERALELLEGPDLGAGWMNGYELIGRLADDMLDGDLNLAKRLIEEMANAQAIERGTEPGKTQGLYRLRPA